MGQMGPFEPKETIRYGWKARSHQWSAPRACSAPLVPFRADQVQSPGPSLCLQPPMSEPSRICLVGVEKFLERVEDQLWTYRKRPSDHLTTGNYGESLWVRVRVFQFSPPVTASGSPFCSRKTFANDARMDRGRVSQPISFT